MYRTPNINKYYISINKSYFTLSVQQQGIFLDNILKKLTFNFFSKHTTALSPAVGHKGNN